MQSPGGPPPEESKALGAVQGLDVEKSTINLASSLSYTCQDVISFDHFVLPHLKFHNRTEGEGGDEQESARENSQESAEELPTSGTVSPRTKLGELPTHKPTTYTANTMELIDNGSENPPSLNSTITTENTDTILGTKSDSQDAPQACVSNTMKQDKQHTCRESFSEGCGQPDNTRSILYNWHLLRTDKIRILDPLWEGFRGSSHDYELLKLLAQTHEHQRWWLIVADDFACPQCVEILKSQSLKPRFPLKNVFTSLQSIYSRHAHCNGGGGRCRIACTHKSEDYNKVTQFFSKLGKENHNRMRNIQIETRADQLPDADVLVSVAHNVGVYFPDVQNLEINFHFGDKHLDRDVWTRILCACRRLERHLPKGQHLRIRGIEKHTELQNDWTRKGRKWHE